MTDAIEVLTAVDKDNLYIPLINFAPFLNGTPSEKHTVATAVLKGFRTAGFIYLSHHGIAPSTLQTVFTLSAAFFALPQTAKDQLTWTSAEANRGYTPHGREKTSLSSEADQVAALREAAPDLKESFEIGRNDEEGRPNRWPEQMKGDAVEWAGEFKERMMDFHTECKEFHMKVMQAIAVGMGIEEAWFDEFTDKGDNTLRLLHYPSVKKDVFDKNKAQVRAGVHTDYGSITLLFQDAKGGLQVQSPDGTFVDATPVPDTVVVNAGDLLARWSNDTIKSTKHQVVEPPTKADEYPARYSIAYFCNPNFDKDIEAIPGTLTDGKAKYDKINSHDYLIQRLNETY